MELGWSLDFPEGFMGQLISHRQLLECRGVGVCEVVWTGGEVLFHLVNHTSETYQIRGGDPIAQLVLIPVPKAIIVEVECPKGSVTREISDPPRRSNIYRERAAPELPVRRSNISRERIPLDPVEIWDLPVLQGGGMPTSAPRAADPTGVNDSSSLATQAGSLERTPPRCRPGRSLYVARERGIV